MTVQADLHVHSDHSDGIYPPARVVQMAAQAGLRAMALTDHDSVEGLDEALRAAPPGLEVIRGAELSSAWRGRDIHLLACDIDHTEPELRRLLAGHRQDRRLRAGRMIERLNRLGIPVTMQEVLDSAGAGPDADRTSLGRPHVADAIVRHGFAADLDEAFVKYLRRGQPGFVPRSAIPVAEALAMVRRHGGWLVIAHPGLNLSDAEVEALAMQGLDGIEVWHPRHAEDQRRRLDAIARRCGLVATGGSDFHGPGRNRHELASEGVDMATVDRLREKAARR